MLAVYWQVHQQRLSTLIPKSFRRFIIVYAYHRRHASFEGISVIDDPNVDSSDSLKILWYFDTEQYTVDRTVRPEAVLNID